MNASNEISASGEIVLRNPARAIVPAATGALTLVMFLPPLLLNALHSSAPLKAVLGAVAVLVTGVYFLHAAWKVPIEARIVNGITIRRRSGVSHHEIRAVRKWFFAVPDGLPTQSSPQTNALLQLWMEDGTHFRGEVTAEEAAILAALLPHVALTNANAAG